MEHFVRNLNIANLTPCIPPCPASRITDINGGVSVGPGDLEMPNQSLGSERCPGQNVSGLITTGSLALKT